LAGGWLESMVRDADMMRGIIYALAAAVLFGASTPLAKVVLRDVPPVLMAGLLYLGSGLGLSVYWVARSFGQAGGAREARLKKVVIGNQ